MKLTYHYLLAVLFTSITLNASAQDLSRKIPANALAVAKIQGKNLTSLLAVNEFNDTFLGKELLSKLSKDSTKTYNSVDDLGFNLSSSFYYYNQSNDSLTYNCFLAPVKNARQLDELFRQHGKDFKTTGTLRSSANSDGTELTFWNDEMFFFIKGSAKDEYFSQPEVSKRYGLADLSSAVDSIVATTATAENHPMEDADDIILPATEQDYAIAQAPVKVPAKRYHSKSHVKKHPSGKTKQYKPGKGKPYKAGQTKPYKAKGKKSVKHNRKKQVKKVQEEIAIDEVYNEEESNNDHPLSYMDSLRLGLKQVETTIIAKSIDSVATDLFAKGSKTSILDNKDYLKSLDDHAAATIWVAGAEKLLTTYIPVSRFKGINFLNGYRSVNAKLYLEEKSIRISTSATFSEQMGSAFDKILKRRVNKSFLKYVNEDKMLGYMAYALDTKAYLQEYPKLLSGFYTSAYSDEINLASDFISLLLDEEAISKVVKGDALFILNGLSQKDVKFTSMEVDTVDFETKEVTKIKKETLPDFLFMFSGEDTYIFNKLTAYGVKKEFLKSNNGYYELILPKSPFALYTLQKDGIVFLSTNKDELEAISHNKYKSQLSGKHKKAMLSGNFSSYFSPKKILNQLPADAFSSQEQLEKTNKLVNTIGDIYIKSTPFSKNTFSGEISMDIPSNQKNALKYLFSLIEDAQK